MSPSGYEHVRAPANDNHIGLSSLERKSIPLTPSQAVWVLEVPLAGLNQARIRLEADHVEPEFAQPGYLSPRSS